MEVPHKIWWSRISWLWALLLLGATGASGLPSQRPAPHLAVGQEWSIGSLQGSTAKIVIGRIEPWRDKIVVHVALVDIPLPPAGVAGNRVTEIAHAPFEESALAASLGDLVATAVTLPPDFESGYRQWKEHQGGIFTVPVSEVIALAQRTVNQHD